MAANVRHISTPWTVQISKTDPETFEVRGAYLVADHLPIEDAVLIAAAPELSEALCDLMARICIDTPEDAAEVSALLGMEDEGALWEAAEKATAALDKAYGKI